MVIAPVIAPVTPPVRRQEGRPAPSALEKLPEPGLRPSVVHAEVEPEQEPKVQVAPREEQVKQQQDWRMLFVDRPATEHTIERLDEFVSVYAGLGTDGLSRRICMLNAIRPDISLKVWLRKVQTGPELGMASRAQQNADEEVASDSDCSRCAGDDRRCKCFHEGSLERNRKGKGGVPVCARCGLASTDSAMRHLTGSLTMMSPASTSSTDCACRHILA